MVSKYLRWLPIGQEKGHTIIDESYRSLTILRTRYCRNFQGRRDDPRIPNLNASAEKWATQGVASEISLPAPFKSKTFSRWRDLNISSISQKLIQKAIFLAIQV